MDGCPGPVNLCTRDCGRSYCGVRNTSGSDFAVLREILPEHDQEKCVLLYEALSLGPVNWAELRENLSEQLAVHEKGDLVVPSWYTMRRYSLLHQSM